MSKRGIAALLLAGGILLAALTYAVLYLIVQRGPVYDFMCGRGFYQHISLALLFYGLLLVAYRRFEFGRELRALQMKLPALRISPEEAAVFAEKIPRKYRDTIFGRRVAEALLGYSRHEDVGPLMDRLAQNDREDLERSASLLSWVRSMPPVLGLLGTLDGLRGGTAEIATISGADSLDKMRNALQRFAVSSSTAFDCTLMGIIAALILSIGIFFVRKREDAYLAAVDLKAQELSRQFRRQSEGDAFINLARDLMAQFFDRLESTVSRSRGA
jgi:biopolymer transport protein ExbB/TolQ